MRLMLGTERIIAFDTCAQETFCVCHLMQSLCYLVVSAHGNVNFPPARGTFGYRFCKFIQVLCTGRCIEKLKGAGFSLDQ